MLLCTWLMDHRAMVVSVRRVPVYNVLPYADDVATPQSGLVSSPPTMHPSLKVDMLGKCPV